MGTPNATVKLVRWVVTAAVLMIAAVIVVVVLVSAQHDSSRSGALVNPSATPTSVKPGSGYDDDTPVAPKNNPYDCSVKFTKVEYAAFVKRLFQFEAIYLTSQSDERASKLAPYSTKDYLKTQTSIPIESTPSLSVQLQASSAYGCYTDDPSTITAYVTPTVDIVDGAGTVQKKGLVLSIHYTQWVKVNGVWYVNQEKN